MSFKVESSPNHFDEYLIFNGEAIEKLNNAFLKLVNPSFEETKSEQENDLKDPSDLCRPSSERKDFYFIDQQMLEKIESKIMPNTSTIRYTTPNNRENNLIDSQEQITTSIDDWPNNVAPEESSGLEQIVTIVQCQPPVNSNSINLENRTKTRNAVRILIHGKSQQQRQIEPFLDLVNEALLLEPDTIKTLWDSKGVKIENPTDLLHRGRLYFASRENSVTLEQLIISDDDLKTINRTERVRHRLCQSAYFIEKPRTSEKSQTPSRKSTPMNLDERREGTVHAQAIAYNDPETFPEIFRRHYSVGDIIGDGRFSAVYECRDKETGIELALKIIDKKRCEGYEYLIENELSILRRVKHPNIIKLIEDYETEHKYYLVFEFIQGGDLLAAISRMNKYSERDTALMISQIAGALEKLHSLYIVHRDVKLDNILRSNAPDGSVTLKLADFGLALCFSDQTPRQVATQSENLCGTPMYMAPEVIENRDYRVENDIWSLGIIAFTLLSGMAPFSGENEQEILSNVVNTPIDFSLLPKISSECREALTSMLERDPNNRITASQLLQHRWIELATGRSSDATKTNFLPMRRRKASNRQQPLLTFSSVENPHPILSTNRSGSIGDIDEI